MAAVRAQTAWAQCGGSMASTRVDKTGCMPPPADGPDAAPKASARSTQQAATSTANAHLKYLKLSKQAAQAWYESLRRG